MIIERGANGCISIRNPGSCFQTLLSVPSFSWDRKRQVMTAPISMDALDAVAAVATLPSDLAETRKRLHEKRKVMEQMRVEADPVPVKRPPVQVKMFDHQVRAYNMALTRFGEAGGNGFGLLFEMGCGKTLTAIAIAGAMWEKAMVSRVLIVCPASVFVSWEQDFANFAAFPYYLQTLSGEKKQRLAGVQHLQSMKGSVLLQVAVINYEATFREGIAEALEAWDPDMIICDESQRIKTHSARQSKQMHRMGDKARYKLILSGTPVQNNAVDLYSQYRFMDSTIFGKNFYAFRNRYCLMGGYGQHQIVGYRNMVDLRDREYSAAMRVTKADALDLPDQIFLDRVVRLDDASRKMYEELRKKSILELENGEQVTAPIVLTKLLRLQQLAGGFLQADEAAKPKPVHSAKIDALRDIVDDNIKGTSEKLVVFARFLPELDAICDMLDQEGVSFSRIDGSVPIAERSEIVRSFQQDDDPQVFVAQLATAGLGITLHRAHMAVFYSVDFNYASYQQAVARIHRIGQKDKCTYVHLIAENTIDQRIMQALGDKKDVAAMVVDGWKSVLE